MVKSPYINTSFNTMKGIFTAFGDFHLCTMLLQFKILNDVIYKDTVLHFSPMFKCHGSGASSICRHGGCCVQLNVARNLTTRRSSRLCHVASIVFLGSEMNFPGG